MAAAVDTADGMVEHLTQLEAAASASACFEALGFAPAVLAQTGGQHASQLSNQACMTYIKSAMS